MSTSGSVDRNEIVYLYWCRRIRDRYSCNRPPACAGIYKLREFILITTNPIEMLVVIAMKDLKGKDCNVQSINRNLRAQGLTEKALVVGTANGPPDPQEEPEQLRRFIEIDPTETPVKVRRAWFDLNTNPFEEVWSTVCTDLGLPNI